MDSVVLKIHAMEISSSATYATIVNVVDVPHTRPVTYVGQIAQLMTILVTIVNVRTDMAVYPSMNCVKNAMATALHAQLQVRVTVHHAEPKIS